MKAKALQKTRFRVNNSVYECLQGQEVEIKPLDVEKAKASGLFEFIQVKEPKNTKAKDDIN